LEFAFLPCGAASDGGGSKGDLLKRSLTVGLLSGAGRGCQRHAGIHLGDPWQRGIPCTVFAGGWRESGGSRIRSGSNTDGGGEGRCAGWERRVLEVLFEGVIRPLLGLLWISALTAAQTEGGPELGLQKGFAGAQITPLAGKFRIGREGRQSHPNTGGAACKTLINTGQNIRSPCH